MHITQVNHRHLPAYGGIERYTDRLVASLSGDGHEVDVVTTDLSLRGDLPPVADGSVTYCRTDLSILRNPLSLELYRTLREGEADVYHLHSPWVLPSLAAVLALPADVPVVLTIHGFQPMNSLLARALERAYRPFAQRIFDRCDRIIVLGASERTRLLSEFDVDPAKVAVVPNAIHPDELDAAVTDADVERFATAYGIDPATPTVLCVGRLVSLKNQHVLVETLRDHLPDVDLDVVVVGAGDDRYARRLRSAADDRFVFLSNVSETELQAAYRVADVFVSLSRAEGLPTVVLEAMNARLPVVTTPAGALADIVVDGEHGWVVSIPPDPADVATALREALSDPERCAEIGERNRAYVRTRFDWDRIANLIAAEYASLLRADPSEATVRVDGAATAADRDRNRPVSSSPSSPPPARSEHVR